MINRNIRIGGPITPVVKRLLIINGTIFLAQLILGSYSMAINGTIQQFFGLSLKVFNEFKIWQLFTYMFLHGGWLHILFNLLTLWMFAGSLEERWGSKLFLKYYIYCGVGAGLFITAMNYYTENPLPTIGASGALYGILLAYGMTWPNREVLLYFLIPVKIKYLVVLFGLIEFFGTINPSGSGISHIGHLGGLISGFILLKFFKLRQRSSNRQRPSSSAGAASTVKSGSKKDNDDFVSTFFKKKRLKKKKREIEQRIEAKEIIENLLEKIARSGMSSLSHEEKKNLEWARKHYYHDDSETLH
ncbi:MAG: rhomboid family intramembrane serine protease [Leptospirales bacterium]|nr:rhomboid family intramembrane serine protease [Leptospirales bacterium]